jgi:hypothetical protein
VEGVRKKRNKQNKTKQNKTKQNKTKQKKWEGVPFDVVVDRFAINRVLGAGWYHLSACSAWIQLFHTCLNRY